MNKKVVIIIFSLLVLLTGASCSTTRGTSVEDKRRGYLMLEGENIYKNKGFYKQKSSYNRYNKKNQKRLKKNKKAAKRRYRG